MIMRSLSTLSALYLHYLQHFTTLTNPDSAFASIYGTGDEPLPAAHSIVNLVGDDDLVNVTVHHVVPSGSHSYFLNIFSQLLVSILA